MYTCVLVLLAACSSDSGDVLAGEIVPAGSLLAVGDTGEPWGHMPWLFEGQLAVGRAMQREHAAAPVDAVLLLGDNFYPNGLLAEELVPRILENLARPYCAFVSPSAELAEQLGEDCPPRPPASRVPELFAVVGNHDVRSPGSLDLERHAIPRFILNWEMPLDEGPAVRELPGGISLIFLVSESPWDAAEVAKLAAVLSAAKGPWKLIVGHRPPIAGHPGLSQMISRASEVSGETVHAYLAGHVHALGAIVGRDHAPALTVIAGSGSHAELQEAREYEIIEADVLVEALGFVRVDSLMVEGERRLRVSLFKARPSPALAFLGSTPVRRYEIDLEGNVEQR